MNKKRFANTEKTESEPYGSSFRFFGARRYIVTILFSVSAHPSFLYFSIVFSTRLTMSFSFFAQ